MPSSKPDLPGLGLMAPKKVAQGLEGLEGSQTAHIALDLYSHSDSIFCYHCSSQLS